MFNFKIPKNDSVAKMNPTIFFSLSFLAILLSIFVNQSQTLRSYNLSNPNTCHRQECARKIIGGALDRGISGGAVGALLGGLPLGLAIGATAGALGGVHECIYSISCEEDAK